MTKYITDEDINILTEQGNISREKAKHLLKKNYGDIVECLLELENDKNINNSLKQKPITKETKEIKDIKEDETVILNTENINKYREIIQEKDKIYEEISNKKKERERKKQLREEAIKNGESVENFEEKKLTNEDIYKLQMKGNFTSIRIL